MRHAHNMAHMLATKDSTSSTMLRALALTSNAIDAAVELDVDRTDTERLCRLFQEVQ